MIQMVENKALVLTKLQRLIDITDYIDDINFLTRKLVLMFRVAIVTC